MNFFQCANRCNSETELLSVSSLGEYNCMYMYMVVEGSEFVVELLQKRSPKSDRLVG